MSDEQPPVSREDRQLDDERVLQDQLLRSAGQAWPDWNSVAKLALAYWLGELVQYVRYRGFR